LRACSEIMRSPSARYGVVAQVGREASLC
jgi:hypothetical protein